MRRTPTNLFATARVSPPGIAWLVRDDDWDSFREVVYYNSGTLGGYFNVVIPVSDSGEISQHYVRLLASFDADYVVLPPGMEARELGEIDAAFCPFALVPWDCASQVAALDPENSFLGTVLVPTLEPTHKYVWKPRFLVAVERNDPDRDALALVACGDLKIGRSSCFESDVIAGFNFSGYRGQFLKNVLKERLHDRSSPHGRSDSDFAEHPVANRSALPALIADENQFPADGAANILRACASVQLQGLSPAISLVGLTGWYNVKPHNRSAIGAGDVGAAILLTDHFGFDEAVRFWNLRAAGIYVAWLPVSQMASEIEGVLNWLDDEFGFWAGINSRVVLAGRAEDEGTIRDIAADIGGRVKNRTEEFVAVGLNDLDAIAAPSPSMLATSVLVSEHGTRCGFVPKLPEQSFRKEFCVTLEWDGMMVPQLGCIRDTLHPPPALDLVEMVKRESGFRYTHLAPLRVTSQRYIRAKASEESPIHFGRLDGVDVFRILFVNGGYPKFEFSNAARFHRNFVERAGGLDRARYFLSKTPYKEFFSLLSNNSDTEKRVGWVLSKPDKRRALHHLHLRNALGVDTAGETRQYFDKDCDILPASAQELLSAGLLERGFLLKCRHCDFGSWYDAERVSQLFDCQRCGSRQPILSNPVWLYKLPEIIFQGFTANMEAPLLAAGWLKANSRASFDWVPEMDIFWNENGTELRRNVDILCLSDGKAFVGEAKSNDKIDNEQMSFYRQLCERVRFDEIVFATTCQRWSDGTINRIEEFRKNVSINVTILTATELLLP